MGPVIIILTVNYVILGLVLRNLRQSSSLNRANRMNFKARCRICFSCCCLLGLSWIFGILAVGHIQIVFQYLFCTFAATQGFALFVFHCILNDEVRRQWISMWNSFKLILLRPRKAFDNIALASRSKTGNTVTMVRSSLEIPASSPVTPSSSPAPECRTRYNQVSVI